MGGTSQVQAGYTLLQHGLHFRIGLLTNGGKAFLYWG